MLLGLHWDVPGTVIEVWAKGNIPIVGKVFLPFVGCNNGLWIVTLSALAKPKIVFAAVDPESGITSFRLALIQSLMLSDGFLADQLVHGISVQSLEI